MNNSSGYPKEEAGRIEFWVRQLEWAGTVTEPFHLIGDRLQALYDNRAYTESEKTSEQTSGGQNDVERIKANLIFAWVDQSIANLLEREPKFSVAPNSQLSTSGSPVVQSAINYWYRETEQFRQDRRCLLDAFLYPYAVKKIGWTSRLTEKEVITPSDISDMIEDNADNENNFLAVGQPTRVTDEQDHEEHIEAHVILMQDPTVDLVIVEEVIEPHIKEHQMMMDMGQPDRHTSIQWDAPFAQRWKPRDFRIDANAVDGQKDAQFVAFRFRDYLWRIKANPNYDNTDNLKPNSRPEDAPAAESSSMDDDDFGMVEGWEIWARDFPLPNGTRRNLLIVVVEGHDHFLRHDEFWPYESIEDYPSAMLAFETGHDRWINKPTLAMAGADNIQSLTNEFMDSILHVVRKQKNVFIYDTDVFEEDMIDSILDAPDSSVFGVEGLSNAQGQPIMALPFTEIPAERHQLLQLIQGMFDRTAGTPQPIRAPGDDTATEVAVNDRRNTARENARGNLFKEFQLETVRKFWQLHTEFRPEREFLIDPRTGDWSAVDEGVAKGEYRFRMDVSSRAQAQAIERKTYGDLLNLSAGLAQTFIALYGAPPNLLVLMELLLTRGYDIQDPETILPAVAPTQAQASLEAALKDPVNKAAILMSLGKMGGPGGDQGIGGAVGPANSQLASQKPATEPNEVSAASRLDGQ